MPCAWSDTGGGDGFLNAVCLVERGHGWGPLTSLPAHLQRSPAPGWRRVPVCWGLSRFGTEIPTSQGNPRSHANPLGSHLAALPVLSAHPAAPLSFRGTLSTHTLSEGETHSDFQTSDLHSHTHTARLASPEKRRKHWSKCSPPKLSQTGPWAPPTRRAGPPNLGPGTSPAPARPVGLWEEQAGEGGWHDSSSGNGVAPG